MKIIFSMMLIAGLAMSCHTSKPSITISTTPSEKNLNKELSGNWELQKLWASDNKWARKPVIIFNYNDKTFTGNNGCNTISGKFTSSGNFISFDKNMLSTKMACPGYSEGAFNNALLKVNKFTINGGELELGQGDIVLLSFKKKL